MNNETEIVRQLKSRLQRNVSWSRTVEECAAAFGHLNPTDIAGLDNDQLWKLWTASKYAETGTPGLPTPTAEQWEGLRKMTQLLCDRSHALGERFAAARAAYQKTFTVGQVQLPVLLRTLLIVEGGRYGTIAAKSHMNRLLQWAGKPEMDYRNPGSITSSLENVRTIIENWAAKVGTESLGERSSISWHLCDIIQENLPITPGSPKNAVLDINPGRMKMLWDRFHQRVPGFTNFPNPGEAFVKEETAYKRRLLEKFDESIGRDKLAAMVEAGEGKQAVQLISRSLTSNIVNFRSWALTLSDRDPVICEILREFLKATASSYHGPSTTQGIFAACARHQLTPGWDACSMLLWALRPVDYFPIKISYYRNLSTELGYDLPSGRPDAASLHQLQIFGRAFWKALEPQKPADWVDVQSFIWCVCPGSYQNILAAPFNAIFSSFEEAQWAFDFLKATLAGLGVTDPNDLRVALTLPQNEKFIRLNFCQWVIASFFGQEMAPNRAEISLLGGLVDLPEKGKFTTDLGEPDTYVYGVPTERLRKAEPELQAALNRSLESIASRFKAKGQIQSGYRKSNRPELMEMVFDPAVRDERLRTGLTQEPDAPSHWIFQGNPDYFDIDQYLLTRPEILWQARQFANEINPGDKVLLWRSGANAGVLAECEVISRPDPGLADDALELYRVPTEPADAAPRCRLHVLNQFVHQPIARTAIKAALPNLNIIRQAAGTNFPISEEEYSTITSLKGSLSFASHFQALMQHYHEEQIIYNSSAHKRRYAIASHDANGVNVERIDGAEQQRVTFAQAEKLINRVQSVGALDFMSLDDTSAVRNTILQAEPLALTADQSRVVYLADNSARLKNFLEVLDHLQTSNPLYKPTMLLCLLDGLDSGELETNRIPFDWIAPRFIAKLKELGKAVTETQAAMPFYHLTSDLIWLHAVPNRTDLMQDGGDGPNAARKKIKYALLKDTYWNLLQDPASRLAVRIKLETLLMPTPEEFLSAAETAIKETGFQHPPGLVRRFLAALAAKPFVILTGNSGTGKTQLAKIIAEWLSPTAPAQDADPFRPGALIESDRIKYYVHNSDTQSVEFWNSKQEDEAIKVSLPRQMIREWADTMFSLHFTQETPARTIREAVVAQSKFSSQLHSFETHLKAAALALLNAKPDPKRESLPTLPRYALVPVGADWTDNRNVVGFVNHLRKDGQQNPLYQSTPVLDLLLRAVADPQRPYFLILDEMNLSHVERYFADFLSAMESKKPIPLHNEIQTLRTPAGDIVPRGLAFPENLFVIGTVNVDETTYMFSPKVLDRANVLEFRIGTEQAKAFLSGSILPVKAAPPALGVPMTFLSLSRRARGLAEPSLASPAEDALVTCRQNLQQLFELLHAARLEFAYRTIAEITRYLQVDFELEPNKTAWLPEPCLDTQILQKILPKLHGSRRRLEAILIALATYCEKRDLATAQKPLQRDADLNSYPPATPPNEVAFPLSRTKLLEMLEAVRREQFVSFIQ